MKIAQKCTHNRGVVGLYPPYAWDENINSPQKQISFVDFGNWHASCFPVGVLLVLLLLGTTVKISNYQK